MRTARWSKGTKFQLEQKPVLGTITCSMTINPAAHYVWQLLRE